MDNLSAIASGFRVPIDWLMGEGPDEIPKRENGIAIELVMVVNRGYELIGRLSAGGKVGPSELISALETASDSPWSPEELQTVMRWAARELRPLLIAEAGDDVVEARGGPGPKGQTAVGGDPSS